MTTRVMYVEVGMSLLVLMSIIPAVAKQLSHALLKRYDELSISMAFVYYFRKENHGNTGAADL